MNQKFEVVFLKQAIDFIEILDMKTKKKIYYNIDKSTGMVKTRYANVN